MDRGYSDGLVEAASRLEEVEKDVCNLALIFAEMFKDEINANDEQKLYDGVKRLVRKYSEDEKAISAIDEFTSVISGGASLKEILEITRDEALNPTLASEMTVDNSCRIKH